MTRRYTYETTLSWGGDEPTAELEAKVSYSVAWGSSPSGLSGPPENYDPGSPDEVEDIVLEAVEGRSGPWADTHSFGFMTEEQFVDLIVTKIEGDGEHYERMIQIALDAEAANEPDHYTEAKDRRLERAAEGSSPSNGALGRHDGLAPYEPNPSPQSPVEETR